MGHTMNTQPNKRDRIIELVEFAAAEGITLPMPPEDIAEIEATGGAVDLLTGEVLPGAAGWLVDVTVIGEATAIVLATDEQEAQR